MSITRETYQNNGRNGTSHARSEPYYDPDALQTGPLSDKHREKLKRESGLSDAAIEARGYWTCEGNEKHKFKHLGLSPNLGDCLMIPICNHRGEHAGQIARPDFPQQGKPKYVMPKGATNVLDVSPLVRESLDDPQKPLVLTEGIKTGDSASSRGLCCITLNGVYGFRGTNDKGGVATLAAFDDIPFIGKKPSGEKFGRVVYVVFDSDVTTNPKVEKALQVLCRDLISRGAVVKVVYLEPAPNGDKTGMDEFFARDGGTVEKLFSMARDLESEIERRRRQSPDGNPYSIENGCIVMQSDRIIAAGTTIVCDFAAKITAETINETGDRMYRVEGQTRHGDTMQVDVDAKVYDDDNALKKLLGAAAGARAPIRAGASRHVGPAIKLLSTADRKIIHRFDRTGWNEGRFLIPGRLREGQEIYLPYDLPYFIDPAAQLDLGVQALEAIIEAQELQATAPLAAIYFQAPFAPLAGLNKRYAAFVPGRTGTFKTTTNQLFLSLYGPKFVEDEFLTRWGEGATLNAVLKQASYCSDLPSLTDNFKPNVGRPNEFVTLTHSIVEGSEKKRLDRNSELQRTRPIRTVPIFTGEDIPDNDPAALARVMVIPFPVFGQRMNRSLSIAQENSRHLCAVGGAWLDWLESDAGRSVAEQAGKKFGARRDEWAQVLYKHNHDTQNAFRIASNLASNELTWAAMLQCPPLSAIAEKFGDAHYSGLKEISKAMATNTAESLEAARYLSAIRQLLSSGKCVLLNRHHSAGNSDSKMGAVVGYEDNDGAYILPDVARTEIEKILGRGGLGGVTDRTIYNQLKQLDKIQTFDQGRLTKTIRTPDGRKVRTIHLKADALNDEGEDGADDE